MPERRRQLVDAGAELVLEQCFQDLLTSVDTRSITSKAGVTTGSFFHHFKNRVEFTEAVLERFAELWEESTDRTLALLGTFGGGGQGNVRRAASSEWSALVGESVLSGLQRLLWVARGQPVTEASSVTGADVLRAHHRRTDAALLPAFERGLRDIGREMLPPFTVLDLLLALTALANGLELRGQVDPEVVRPDLYGDLAASVVMSITRPARERIEPAVTVDAPSGPRPPGLGRELQRGTRGQIAEAAAPLFADRRVGDVRIAEIADVAGVSASTVYHQFGRVSAVAAAGWMRHLPELEAISAEPLTSREGPVVRMEQVLSRCIQLGRENRGALEGMVLESVTVAVDAPSQPAATTPIGELLLPHIRELRARGVLRRRIDSASLARSVMQLLAMRVLAFPDEPEERIIDDTLGLVLEGALARLER